MKGLITSVEACQERLASDADCLIVDCRFSLADPQQGQRDYETGHLPGARYADLERHLSSPAGAGGRHPLPDFAELAEQFRAWGINNRSHIICYDEGPGAIAGRFWWLARWLGHADVEVLDGGVNAWLAAGHELSTVNPDDARGTFEARPPLTRVVDADAIDAESQAVLDARDHARFIGENEPIDPVAGHIPGATNAPFSENLTNGQFRPADDLSKRFSQLGLNNSDNIVCYCGSGVTATHNILALKLAGFAEPALYPGSWSGWITDVSRPVATGE